MDCNSPSLKLSGPISILVHSTLFAGIGACTGTLFGLLKKVPKTIRFKGLPESQLLRILKKLDRQARFKSFRSPSSTTGMDYYFGRHISVRVRLEYNYAPMKVESFRLDAPFDGMIYGSGDTQAENFTGVTTLQFPHRTFNYGGWGTGLSIGFHF